MAESLVDSLTAAFDPAKYCDEYREQVTDLIEMKAAGQEFEVPDAPADKPKVVDLMAALEASVAKAKQERSASAKKPKKASAARAKKSA